MKKDMDLLDWISLLYGNPMDVFASCLRAMIIPSEGRTLYAGDYAAIEVRVLFWLAKHEAGLRALREGRDLYRELATKIFGKPLDQIGKPEREIGKRAILGCGYNMGKKKFAESCALQGQPVTDEIAETAVRAYRETNRPVVLLWSNIEKAAIAAVLNRKKKYKINRTSWWCEDGFLYCELPSGRRLAYYGPEIRTKATPWGEKRPCLYHWGVNPISKKWEISGTYGGKLAENITQGAARDFMAANMPRLEDAGYEILLSVHDELLTEREAGTGSVDEFERLMASPPDWALDCPVAVEGWTGERYRK